MTKVSHLGLNLKEEFHVGSTQIVQTTNDATTMSYSLNQSALRVVKSNIELVVLNLNGDG